MTATKSPSDVTQLPFEVARKFLTEWCPGYSHAQSAALGRLLARFSGVPLEEAVELAAPSELEPVHISILKHMALSPAHYQAALTDKSDSPPKRFGRLVHCIVLGGAYTVYDGDRRGNRWKEFEAEHKTDEIVTTKEFDEAHRVAESVLKHPLAAPLLVGEREVGIEWEFCGRRCSSRLDVIGRDFVADLKTAQSAEPGRFVRQGLGLAYHAQLGFYREAAIVRGFRPEHAFVIAVETKPPYAVTVLEFTKEALAEGLKLARLWMEQLLVCEASNQWPAYTQAIVPFGVSEDFALIMDDGEEVAA